jgi:GNAT superfamily N-acetyltransferase
MSELATAAHMKDGVHPVRARDIPSLVDLCAAHARYEKAAYDTEGKATFLHRALFTTPPRLFAWLAWQAGLPIGYTTASVEFSTFTGCEYLHMDCLFMDAGTRGKGIGQTLLDAVIAKARSLGLGEIQWQTPEWNLDAIRFYIRQGAAAKLKQRFVLSLGSASCFPSTTGEELLSSAHDAPLGRRRRLTD